MACAGGFQKGSSVDPSRLPSALQKRFGRLIESSKASKLLSARFDYSLPRSSQTKCAQVNDTRSGGKKVCDRNGRERERVFLKGISGSKEIGGLEVSDRSVTVEQIINPSLISNGYTEQDQTGIATRDVGYFDRLIGCISPHSDQGVVSVLPLFSSGEGKIQVSSSPIWPHVRSMAIHGDSEAIKAVGSSEPSRIIPISGRLVKSKSVQKRVDSGNAYASPTVYKPRIVGKHEKIRASSSSVDSLPRGKARSDTRHSRQSNEKQKF